LKISNRIITTNRIPNQKFDSKSNRILKLRRSLVICYLCFVNMNSLMILCCISQVFCQANGCVLMLPARITFSIGCKTDAVCLWNFGLNSIEFRWSASVPAISLTEPIDRYAKKFATNANAMPDPTAVFQAVKCH